MDSKVTMLAVGQGAMNLIEIYDVLEGDRVLVNLSLIDCGSIDGQRVSKAACERALGYAVEKMLERYRLGDEKMLDNLLITHKDGDHWNLLDRLFQMAIGVETALISENIGYLKVEESVDCIEKYYANRIEKIFRYEKNHYAECEMELTLSFKVNGQVSEPDVVFEYEYGDDYMSVCWNPQTMSVFVLDESTRQNKLMNLCMNGEYSLLPPGEDKWGIWKVPSSYREFMILFFGASGIYQRIRGTAIDMPAEHEALMLDMLGKIKVKQEDIEKVTLQNPKYVPPFIQNVYIGGNMSESSKRFSTIENTLIMLSQNYENGIHKGKSIELYGGIRLYIIENMEEDKLKRVVGAESVSKSSIKNNATSIVSVLLLGEVPEFEKIIFTGDATVHTFYQMLLDINTDIEQGKTIIYQDATWTAPHHGAYTTIHGWIPYDQKGREVFPSILGVLQPKKMVVSAGVKNIHGHPSRSFMYCVSGYFEYRKLQAMLHFVYRNKNNNNRASGAKWEFAQINLPLYTTYTRFANGSEGYMDYAFFFPPRNAVPAENMLLLENREEPAGRVFGSTTIPAKTEIPSKSMFFHR